MVKKSHMAYGIINGEICEVVQPDDSDKLDAGTPFFSFLKDAERKLHKYRGAKKSVSKKDKVDVAKTSVSDFKKKIESIANGVIEKKV